MPGQNRGTASPVGQLDFRITNLGVAMDIGTQVYFRIDKLFIWHQGNQ